MISRFGVAHRRCFGLLPCAIVLLSAGCIAFPVRMSPELLGQPGVSADHTFIKVGQTSRDEVLRSLGWTDTGMRESRLFWGSWKASTSGTVVVFAIPGAMGGERNRNWLTHNLLVEFDENGTVSRAREVKEKDIVRELFAWSRQSVSAASSFSLLAKQSFEASTGDFRGNHDGRMTVRSDSLEFFDRDSRTTFRIPYSDVEGLKTKNRGRVSGKYTLRFKTSTAWGKSIDVSVNPPYLLALIRQVGLARG